MSHDFSRFFLINVISIWSTVYTENADEHVLAQKNAVVFWNSHELYHKNILIIEHVT